MSAKRWIIATASVVVMAAALLLSDSGRAFAAAFFSIDQSTPGVTNGVFVTNSPAVTISGTPNVTATIAGTPTVAVTTPATGLPVSVENGSISVAPASATGLPVDLQNASVNVAPASAGGLLVTAASSGLPVSIQANPASARTIEQVSMTVSLAATENANQGNHPHPEAYIPPQGKIFVIETVTAVVLVPHSQHPGLSFLIVSPTGGGVEHYLTLDLQSLADGPQPLNDTYRTTLPIRLYVQSGGFLAYLFSRNRSDGLPAQARITLSGYLIDETSLSLGQ